MAFKSFLTSEEWSQAQELITPPLMKPDGDVRQAFYFSNDAFSSWLGQALEEKIKNFSEWRKTHPIALGSWARGELCPKSDIDMLFCGDEGVVKQLIESLQEQGFKLRYRMPQDEKDWTVGVEVFDVLALLKARPWTSEAAQKLHEQQKKIWSQKKQFRRDILKAVTQERGGRARRYDSITNYLEPHLKFGPGGLRDLEQGLQIYELFSEKFHHPGHALNILSYYRNFFLSIRQKLHLQGQGDVLSSTAQFDLAKWMGYGAHKEFMRELERGLSRVNFYSDWIVDVAGSSAKDLQKIENSPWTKPEQLLRALEKSPRLLVQKKVRESLDTVFGEKKSTQGFKIQRRILEQILDVKAADATLVSVFRSRFIDKLVPEIQRLVGYVQHDQYHRFTADSHIMQACREVKRVYRKPDELGPLKVFYKELKPIDWKIVSWTALYHDLAKGLGAGELHGDLGTQFVERDFKRFGFSNSFTDEVRWMVENHLELSHAAFRKNPRDPQLWQELQQKGIQGRRLYRLALFTAIDIRATNPEAWNEWKAKLLRDLCLSLESQKAQDLFHLRLLLKKTRVSLSSQSLEELSPVLLESLGMRALVLDMENVFNTGNVAPAVFKTRQNDLWVRFHSPVDRPGLLAEYVRLLFTLGLGVRHAAVHTFEDFGVYDWFQLNTQKDLKQVKMLLEKGAGLSLKELPGAQFESIDLVSATDDEWVFLFKGLDQSGLLATAAASLSELGVNILSARVHTWGRKVEDVFIVKAQAGALADQIVQDLNKKMITRES